jgi:hypothetical protein
MAAPATASRQAHAPASAPTAAVAHKVAAVFSPVTDEPCFMITPAPRNPTPVTIWATTRVGFSVAVEAVSAQNHIQRRTHADQRHGLQPGHPGSPLAFDADRQTKHGSQANAHQQLGGGHVHGRDCPPVVVSRGAFSMFDHRTKISGQIRRWRLHRDIGLNLAELARHINPVVRGWTQYYRAFDRSKLYAPTRTNRLSWFNPSIAHQSFSSSEAIFQTASPRSQDNSKTTSWPGPATAAGPATAVGAARLPTLGSARRAVARRRCAPS